MTLLTAFKPLASVVLTGNDTDITFANIPQGYKDLILVSNQYANQINEGYMRFNGSTTGFAHTRMIASGSGLSAANGDGNFFIPTATGPITHILHIVDYSATDKFKHALLETARSSEGIVAYYAIRWASTAALTSLSLYPQGGFTFIAGARMYLYGIEG